MSTALKLIRNVRILSPQAEPCDLLFAGHQIAAVGEDLSLYGSLAETYDAEGRVGVPGYFDQHVHVTGGGGEGGFIYKVPEITLRSIVEGGVTSLVGLLGTDGISRSVDNLVSKVYALREQHIQRFAKYIGHLHLNDPFFRSFPDRDRYPCAILSIYYHSATPLPAATSA